jgi:hypothetical protein
MHEPVEPQVFERLLDELSAPPVIVPEVVAIITRPRLLQMPASPSHFQ